MNTMFAKRLLDLLAPRCCCGCGARLALTEQYVCTSCLLSVPRTGFASDPYENPMARLYYGRLPVERVAAWAFYSPDNISSRMVKTLKYHGLPALGDLLGRIMGAELQKHHFFDGIDVLMPIPLAPTRLHERGYNQSRHIAQGLSLATGIPIADGVVVRTEFKGSQTRLAHADRQKNVDDVFLLKAPDAVAGSHVLIVDDVVTTGATTMSFGRELLKINDVKASILALTFTKD